MELFNGGLTENQVKDLFSNEDLPRYEARVSDGLHVPLYQHEYDALVSLAFNTWAALGHASTITKLLNQGKYDNVPNIILQYNKVNIGAHHLVVSDGLAKRRAAEADIFINSNYVMHK